jgi:hypothetical protein
VLLSSYFTTNEDFVKSLIVVRNSAAQFALALMNSWASIIKKKDAHHLWVFKSVFIIAFQSVFYSEKYINNIFLFFKISISK